jgi:hypothetical protein
MQYLLTSNRRKEADSLAARFVGQVVNLQPIVNRPVLELTTAVQLSKLPHKR